jgi:hypothetical protein
MPQATQGLPLREARCPFCERWVLVYEEPPRCPLCACPIEETRLDPFTFPGSSRE